MKSLMQPRGSFTNMKHHGKKKKKCEKGSSCPYQDEQQHMQEFDHDGPAEEDEEGGEEKGKPKVIPFQGKGYRLSNSSSKAAVARPQSGQSKRSLLLSALEKRLKESDEKEDEPSGNGSIRNQVTTTTKVNKPKFEETSSAKPALNSIRSNNQVTTTTVKKANNPKPVETSSSAKPAVKEVPKKKPSPAVVDLTFDDDE